MHQISEADGAGVAIAAVGEDDIVRPGQLVADGEGRRTAVRGFNGVDIHVMMGETAAADTHDGNGPFADAQFFDGLGHKPRHDAVPASGTVTGQLVQK